MADEPQPSGPNDPAPIRPPSAGAGRQDADESASWFRMAGIGFEFVVAVGLFALIGWAADRKLGTSPWLVLVGCGIGFTVGLWTMVTAANRMMR